MFDVRWSDTVTYRQVRLADEQQMSSYSFDYADPVATRKQFDSSESEARRILELWPKKPDASIARFPLIAAYELTLKCSHLFNVLDARGAISVTERAAMIARIRKLAVRGAELWLKQRELVAAPTLQATAEVRA